MLLINWDLFPEYSLNGDTFDLDWIIARSILGLEFSSNSDRIASNSALAPITPLVWHSFRLASSKALLMAMASVAMIVDFF